MAMNTSIARIASGARKINFFRMFNSSWSRKFVVYALQSLAQMPHRISLAREQRIHAHAGLGGQLLEAAPLQLVGHKHLSLLLRQPVDRQRECIEQHVAGVKRL